MDTMNSACFDEQCYHLQGVKYKFRYIKKEKMQIEM